MRSAVHRAPRSTPLRPGSTPGPRYQIATEPHAWHRHPAHSKLATLARLRQGPAGIHAPPPLPVLSSPIRTAPLPQTSPTPRPPLVPPDQRSQKRKKKRIEPRSKADHTARKRSGNSANEKCAHDSRRAHPPPACRKGPSGPLRPRPGRGAQAQPQGRDRTLKLILR